MWDRSLTTAALVMTTLLGSPFAKAVTGDLNGDRRVDVRDAVQAIRFALGLDAVDAAALRNADVYPVVGREGRIVGDGRVDLSDAARLLRCAAGLLSESDLRGQSRISVLAGAAGQWGWVDGPGRSARFKEPWTLAADGKGGLIVADAYNGAIRRVDRTGRVTTVAGDQTTPETWIRAGYADGPVDQARFNKPQAVAAAPDGTIYVADTSNHSIRRIRDGQVTTVAGDGRPGFRDGVGVAARFNEPLGIAVGRDGIYVADSGNRRIRRISDDGTVTTVAGTGRFGFDDGPAEEARFASPSGLIFGEDGSLYISDCPNARIRRLSPDGKVSTYAGDGHTGLIDGPAQTARFIAPMGLALDREGNLYVADWEGPTIRRITRDGWVTTLAGANGMIGSYDGTGPSARFSAPMGIAIEGNRAYVADTDNHLIRRIDLPRP